MLGGTCRTSSCSICPSTTWFAFLAISATSNFISRVTRSGIAFRRCIKWITRIRLCSITNSTINARILSFLILIFIIFTYLTSFTSFRKFTFCAIVTCSSMWSIRTCTSWTYMAQIWLCIRCLFKSMSMWIIVRFGATTIGNLAFCMRIAITVVIMGLNTFYTFSSTRPFDIITNNGIGQIMSLICKYITIHTQTTSIHRIISISICWTFYTFRSSYSCIPSAILRFCTNETGFTI